MLLLLHSTPSKLTSIAASRSSLDGGLTHAIMLLLSIVASASSL
jgi:hypothetical protein